MLRDSTFGPVKGSVSDLASSAIAKSAPVVPQRASRRLSAGRRPPRLSLIPRGVSRWMLDGAASTTASAGAKGGKPHGDWLPAKIRGDEDAVTNHLDRITSASELSGRDIAGMQRGAAGFDAAWAQINAEGELHAALHPRLGAHKPYVRGVGIARNRTPSIEN